MTDTVSPEGTPYTWDQTLQDVSITLELEEAVPSSEVSVSVSDGNLVVFVSGNAVLSGRLHKPVVGCTFMMDDEEVEIELEKHNKMEWWTCVIEGHEEIDTSTIQPENGRLSDLDPETRQVVEKMMIEQRQRQMGIDPGQQQLQQQLSQSGMTPAQQREMMAKLSEMKDSGKLA